jgi:predicted PurR-regulated permease PerM
VRGQILLCLILAVLYAFAFWAIRVPQWWFVGPVGAIAAIIPRLGSIVPVGLAALSLYLAHAPLSRYLLLVAVWLAVQGIEFFVLLPRLISRPLGLKEVPVLAALLLGSLIFGPLGLLFAVPVLAIGLVFWRHFRRRSTS